MLGEGLKALACGAMTFLLALAQPLETGPAAAAQPNPAAPGEWSAEPLCSTEVDQTLSPLVTLWMPPDRLLLAVPSAPSMPFIPYQDERASYSTTFYLIDLASGQVDSTSWPGFYLTAYAYDTRDGRVYLAGAEGLSSNNKEKISEESSLLCYDRSGELVWRTTMKCAVDGLTAGEQLYAMGKDNYRLPSFALEEPNSQSTLFTLSRGDGSLLAQERIKAKDTSWVTGIQGEPAFFLLAPHTNRAGVRWGKQNEVLGKWRSYGDPTLFNGAIYGVYYQMDQFDYESMTCTLQRLDQNGLKPLFSFDTANSGGGSLERMQITEDAIFFLGGAAVSNRFCIDVFEHSGQLLTSLHVKTPTGRNEKNDDVSRYISGSWYDDQHLFVLSKLVDYGREDDKERLELYQIPLSRLKP